ncbi:MAG: hypothetical protein ACFCU3_10780 [Verrucomicrobiales bacterium]
MFLAPRQLETLEQHSPWANWLIILVCCFVSGAIFFGYLPHEQQTRAETLRRGEYFWNEGE